MKTRNTYVMSPEGKKKLQEKLRALRDMRPSIVDELQKARAMGDLSENSAYHAAKSHLTDIDHRIAKIELMLRKSTVVHKKQNGIVQVGSIVVIKNDTTEMTIILVGESEANPKEKKISVKAPLGKSLLGRKKGDVAVLETPNGTVSYTVISVK